MATQVRYAGLKPLAHQRIVMNSTATLLNSTSQTGTFFLITVEAADARMTFDGTTTPTANTGILLMASNVPYPFEGVDTSKWKFARNAAGTILQVAPFKMPGDK